MQYLVIGRDGNDPAKRQAQRAAHLEGAKELKEKGKLLYAAAILEDGQMKGSMMVFDFASEHELAEWKQSEPYITGGVWETVEVTACAVAPLFAK